MRLIQNVLIIDADRAARDLVKKLSKRDSTQHGLFAGRRYRTGSRAQTRSCHSLIEPSDECGLLTLKQILQTSPLSLVIVCSEKVDGFLALQSMRLGALDYLIKPVDITELVESMQRILNHQRVFCLGIEPDGESVVSETKTLSSGTTPIGSPISSTRR